MVKNWKTATSLFTVSIMLLTIVAGCSTSKSTTESSPSAGATSMSTATPIATAAPATPTATPVKLTIYKDAKNAEDPNFIKELADFKAQTGITVEANVIPGNGDDFYKKMDVALTTGDPTDLVILDNPLDTQKYSENGFLYPLDDIMAEKSYDPKKVFGNSLTVTNGKVYMLPSAATKWAVFYNKKIFDDAKVPYPTGDAWTWDQYIETAKKLTDKSKGIYGSYMLDYDNYMYFYATQQGDGVHGYKADGTSNYDDPIFKNALKYFGDFGNVSKIQPSWLEFKTKKLAWDGFMSGKYGMTFIGSWFLNLMKNKKTYPRDWKMGISQIPTPTAGQGNNFGVTSGLGVNKNSAHPKEAFEFVKFDAENFYKYSGAMPARVDLAKPDIDALFADTAAGVGGDVTPGEISKALIDNKLGYVQEKIVGPAANEYNNIILQESELYLIGKKSLDDTTKAIKTRADKAIADAAAAAKK